MPYTDTWSVIIPAGSDPLNTADDQIRQLRVDIEERMNDIVGDFTVDPIISWAGARVYVNASFALPSAAATTIDFVGETFDTNTFHDNAVNPSRLTVPVAGYYRIFASIGITSGAAAAVGTMILRKNGSVILTNALHQHVGGSVQVSFILGETVLLAASDYVELRLSQSSGNSWTTSALELGAYLTITLEKRTA